MLDKIIIVDFEDSFTYNIASVLFPFEKSIKVISHHDFFYDTASRLLSSNDRHAVILGPGPGHPKEHTKYFQTIQELKKSPMIYLMGICLGHQILGMIEGLEVRSSENQMHGQAVKTIFKNQTAWVQRYNSLSVYNGHEVVDILNFSRGISYQFHPESIGTTENELFFEELLRFVESIQ
jgi:anthranilate synthase component II